VLEFFGYRMNYPPDLERSVEAMEIRILGIDPSIVNCGFALIRGTPTPGKFLSGGIGTLDATLTLKPNRNAELGSRLEYLYDGTYKTIVQFKPDRIIIEEPPAYVRQSTRLKINRQGVLRPAGFKPVNVKSILKLQLAFGVIVLAGIKAGYTETQENLILLSANKGVAKKFRAQEQVWNFWEIKLNSHEADAAMLALWSFQRGGR